VGELSVLTQHFSVIPDDRHERLLRQLSQQAAKLLIDVSNLPVIKPMRTCLLASRKASGRTILFMGIEKVNPEKERATEFRETLARCLNNLLCRALRYRGP
jgi:hypothetical protein